MWLKVQNFTEKPTNRLKKKRMRKEKETWIEEQCQGIKENLQKNNSKKAYQLCKELTSSKEGRTTTIQDKAGKCLTEEQDILKRWTEYCSELYSHNNRRYQGARCPSTNQQWQQPCLAGSSWNRSKISEERQVSRSGQHSIGAGPSRRRGHDS